MNMNIDTYKNINTKNLNMDAKNMITRNTNMRDANMRTQVGIRKRRKNLIFLVNEVEKNSRLLLLFGSSFF